MRGRLVRRLSLVALLFGTVAPGMMQKEAAAATPISSCGPIMESGSYELTQNIASYGGDCIMVQAPFVTIDLKGFSIASGSTSGTGIAANGSLVVRDGTIYNFSTGIRAGEGAVIERVRLAFNGVGVDASLAWGGSVVVKDSVFNDNQAHGILMTSGTVTGSLFNRNSTAILSTRSSMITSNTLAQNGTGIDVQGAGASVQNNTVTDSWNAAIRITCPANIIGNTVTGSAWPFIVQDRVWECNFGHNVVRSW